MALRHKEGKVIDTPKLMLGDCIERLKEIDTGSVAMVLMDPPYGTTNYGWDKQRIDLDSLWAEIWRVCRDNAAVLSWAADPFGFALVESSPNEYRYKYMILKNRASNFPNARKMPLRVFEEVLVFYRLQPCYVPLMEQGHPRKTARRKGISAGETLYNAMGENLYDSTERYPVNVRFYDWRAAEDMGRNHPSRKPLAACRDFILTYTQKGDTVLDPFMGSGTVGIACAETGRGFIGVEMDAAFFEGAKERVEDAFNRKTPIAGIFSPVESEDGNK